MELNREQIIKALECCGTGCFDIATCDRCPFEPKEEGKGSLGCNDELIRNALLLIKELTEKNERLKERNIALEQKLMLLGCDEQYFFKAQVKGE